MSATETDRIRTALAFDQEDPLARIPGETSRANQALRDYYHQGTTRSLRKLLAAYREQIAAGAASEPPTRRLQTLTGWSMTLAWQMRIDAQEALDRKAESAARQRALEESARLWAERREQLREQDWSDAQALRDLARTIVKEGPKYIKASRRVIRGEGDQPDREVITLALDGALAVRAMETSSKLQRLSAGMETEHTVTEDLDPGEDIDALRQRRTEKAIRDLNTPALTGEESE